MKIINLIWQDLRQGENIDSYIAILIALGLSVANIFGLASQSLLASVTLAVLALLAITNLGNRHRLDMAMNKSNNEFFMRITPESLPEDIKNAKELWLVGFTLTRTVVTYSTMIDEKLEYGEKVKVLLMDPDGTGLGFANKLLYYPMSEEQYHERIRVTISGLLQISKDNRANLEIRTINFPFAFGAHAMDIMSSSGKIYVRFYEYRTKIDGPRILMTLKNEHWYEYYREQLLALWNDAKPYDM